MRWRNFSRELETKKKILESKHNIAEIEKSVDSLDSHSLREN